MIRKSLLVDDRIPLPGRQLLPLVQQLLGVPKSQALKIIQSEGATVNRRIVSRSHIKLEIGDRLEVSYEPDDFRPPVVASSSAAEVEYVFEDEHLLVVDKPPELLTVPTPHRERNTLLHKINQHLERGKPQSEAFCCHRLDRGVSGLLVFAKRLEVAEAIRGQFHDRKPQRRYIALVHGQVQTSEGTFRSRLMTDENLNRYSTEEPELGELAITHYRVLESFASFTQVEVRLETGRRNQIRVHFAEAGQPILGDTRYGPRTPAPFWPFKRMALHAASLGFTHPITKESLEFTLPLPIEMHQLVERARRQAGAPEDLPASSRRTTRGRRPKR